ncbi:MAG: hypothetical protein IJ685_08770 [Selenomonadaceae bacterium]|nr:hypothetical protein [Selenomonadaceae bacterium]
MCLSFARFDNFNREVFKPALRHRAANLLSSVEELTFQSVDAFDRHTACYNQTAFGVRTYQANCGELNFVVEDVFNAGKKVTAGGDSVVLCGNNQHGSSNQINVNRNGR